MRYLIFRRVTYLSLHFSCRKAWFWHVPQISTIIAHVYDTRLAEWAPQRQCVHLSPSALLLGRTLHSYCPRLCLYIDLYCAIPINSRLASRFINRKIRRTHGKWWTSRLVILEGKKSVFFKIMVHISPAMSEVRAKWNSNNQLILLVKCGVFRRNTVAESNSYNVRAPWGNLHLTCLWRTPRAIRWAVQILTSLFLQALS